MDEGAESLELRRRAKEENWPFPGALGRSHTLTTLSLIDTLLAARINFEQPHIFAKWRLAKNPGSTAPIPECRDGRVKK